VRYPAALPAVALLAGVACGWQQPTLGRDVIALLALMAWLATTVVVGRRLSPGVVLAPHAVPVRVRMVIPMVVSMIVPMVVPTMVALSFLVVGALLGGQATTRATTSSLTQWYERHRAERVDPWPVVVEGRLTRDATPTDYGASLSLDVDVIRSPNGPQAVSGRARVTVGGQVAPDRVTDWVAGRRLRLPVAFRQSARYLNPGVPDQQRALMWRGTSLLGSVKSGLLVEIVDSGGWWSETAAKVRAEVRHRVAQTVGAFSRRSAGVVTAVLIGDRAGLESDDRRRLQEGARTMSSPSRVAISPSSRVCCC